MGLLFAAIALLSTASPTRAPDVRLWNPARWHREILLASRNSSGTYSLPGGNPVVSGTTITSSWANTTLSDLGSELTNSLDRNGRGAMLAPLQLSNGSVTSPSLTFASEAGSGIYRAGAGDVRMSVTQGDVQKWLATGATITGTLNASGAFAAGTASAAATTGDFIGAGQAPGNTWPTTLSTSSGIAGSILVGDSGSSTSDGGAVFFSAASSSWRFAGIKGLVASGLNNTAGHLGFFVRKVNTDATLSEGMRLSNDTSLDLVGDFRINTNKFTVAGTSGNTAVAGTLGVTGTANVVGDFSVNTNKFTVTASNGNGSFAGTLGVTGILSATDRVRGADGTLAAPEYSFTSETGSGLFRSGASDVRMAVAGALSTTWNATGFGIGVSASNPFHIEGSFSGGTRVAQKVKNTSTTTSSEVEIDLLSGASGHIGAVAMYGSEYSNATYADYVQLYTTGAGLLLSPSSASGVTKITYSASDTTALQVDSAGKLTTTVASPAGLTQEAWTAVTYTNSWVDDGTYAAVKYMKDSQGFIHIRGAMKNGTVGSTSFTLPSGYRPATQEAFYMAGNNVPCIVQVASSGAVTALGGGTCTNVFVSLSGITFDTR